MVPKIIKIRSCEGKHTITETFVEHIVTGGINARWNCGVFRKKQQCLSKCKSDWRKWTRLDTSVLHLFEKREWNLPFLLFHFSSQKGNDQEKHLREAICITIFLLSHCLCLLAESVLLVNVIWEIVGVYLRHSTVLIKHVILLFTKTGHIDEHFQFDFSSLYSHSLYEHVNVRVKVINISPVTGNVPLPFYENLSSAPIEGQIKDVQYKKDWHLYPSLCYMLAVIATLLLWSS